MPVGQLDATDRVFDPTQLEAVYQPIVALGTGEVVAAEALARWPRLGIGPEGAFDLARRQSRVGELDVLCQEAALRGAVDANLPEGFRLFVNVEPAAPVPTLAGRAGGATVVAEITERALLDDPARLLASLRRLRARGCGIALDDVGAVPDTLALLPFVAPDVVKLDVSLVQAWPDAEQARILTAVAAHAERTGATVLAEGIETAHHLEQALALGATLGQGWYFSRPGPLVRLPRVTHPVPLLGAATAGSPTAAPAGTPFGLLGHAPLREAEKGLLLAMSHHLEHQGLGLETPPLVLSAFQDAAQFTPATVRRYTEMAARCPLVVALGAGLPAAPAPGVRGADLAADDRLRGEWTVVVVGPHYTGALIAKDLGDRGPELRRRFRFLLTHDPAIVLPAARLLLERVSAA